MKHNNQITVIVGSQWGDEGKGKITDYFASRANYVVRFNGGNNAGHTLVVKNEVYKLHLIPSGILSPKTTSVIGCGVLVDPESLLQEIAELKKRVKKINLKISERAHIIMPYHRTLDGCMDSFQGALAAGSTKRGIATVAADKMYRHGIRVGDLLEPEILREKLKKSYEFNVGVITKIFGGEFTQTEHELYEACVKYGKQLKPYITDTEVELYTAYKQGKKILFEGAQGMSLDIDHGVYPHTTSTNNIAGHISVGAGVGINNQYRAIGVMKAYTSRVGVSPFVTELTDEIGNYIRETGKEYGTTTGRPRRVGWLDLVQVRQSVRTSGLTDIAITKLDILGGMKEIKVCTAYKLPDGSILTEMPASLSKIREAKPVYVTLPGWESFDGAVTNAMVKAGFEALSKNMKNYIKYIEKNIKCPISIVSVGPERGSTIIR